MTVEQFKVKMAEICRDYGRPTYDILIADVESIRQSAFDEGLKVQSDLQKKGLEASFKPEQAGWLEFPLYKPKENQYCVFRFPNEPREFGNELVLTYTEQWGDSIRKDIANNVIWFPLPLPKLPEVKNG